MKITISILLLLLSSYILHASTLSDINNNNISLLNRDNILDFVKSNQYAFILFYIQPMNRITEHLYNSMNELAIRLNDNNNTNPLTINLTLGFIDSTDIPKFTKKYFHISKYPALIFFTNGKQIRYDNPAYLTDNLLTWLKRITRSAQIYSSVIYTEDDIKNFVAKYDHTTIFFGDIDTKNFEIYHTIAKKWPDSKFAHTSNEELKSIYNITKEFGIVIHNKAEKNIEDIITIAETDSNNEDLYKDLQNLIYENTGTTIHNFEHRIYHQITRNLEPFLILFLQNQSLSESQGIIEELKLAAKKVKRYIHVTIIEHKGPDESERIFNDEGLTVDELPAIYIVDKAHSRRYKFDGNIIASRIENFVYKWKAKQLKPIFKSAPIPEKNEGPIIEVVHKTWNEIVINNDKDVFVEFYSPGCYQCKEVEPEYLEVANMVKDNENLVLARVDVTANEIEDVIISGTPSWRFFKKGKKREGIPVYGAKNVANILESLKSLVSYPWIINENLNKLHENEGNGISNVLGSEKTTQKRPKPDFTKPVSQNSVLIKENEEQVQNDKIESMKEVNDKNNNIVANKSELKDDSQIIDETLSVMENIINTESLRDELQIF